MKKLIATLVLIAMTLFALSSCYLMPGLEKTEKVTIGVMSGPTGMGMAKLMNDTSADSEKYDFKIYSDPALATADLANGTVQMLCLPTNLAANLSIKKDDYISTIAINCLGSLYVVTNSNTTISDISDLEGKTIYASVPTSTTGPIINYILEKNNVNAEIVFEADHQALAKKVITNQVDIAILPEPVVSNALSKNTSFSIDLNLSEEWNKVSDEPLTMGCIVVRNDFLEKYETTVNVFLRHYKNSINYIANPYNLESAAQMIVDANILTDVTVAKSALEHLEGSIVYIDGVEMENALKNFYDAIGNAQPSDDFYYKKW